MVPSVIPLKMQLPKADDCLNLDNIDRDIGDYVLKTVFGYESFRPGQMEAISSIVRGGDTLALLPTGGGKSVVYTVPAIIKQGLTVVIEPLKFIMEEQTEKLRESMYQPFTLTLP
jgi:ATP-dependent DNA helicase RecQ